eukprot:g7344.t1
MARRIGKRNLNHRWNCPQTRSGQAMSQTFSWSAQVDTAVANTTIAYKGLLMQRVDRDDVSDPLAAKNASDHEAPHGEKLLFLPPFTRMFKKSRQWTRVRNFEDTKCEEDVSLRSG